MQKVYTVLPNVTHLRGLRALLLWTKSTADVQDFNRVWKGLKSIDCQRMSLVWETNELLALNSSIINFLKDQVCIHVPSHVCASDDHVQL